MKLSTGEKTGITTTGATGLLILSGIIFSDMSLWWLLVSIPLLCSAVGHEHGMVKKD